MMAHRMECFQKEAVIAGRRHVYMHDRVVYMYICLSYYTRQ